MPTVPSLCLPCNSHVYCAQLHGRHCSATAFYLCPQLWPHWTNTLAAVKAPSIAKTWPATFHDELILIIETQTYLYLQLMFSSPLMIKPWVAQVSSSSFFSCSQRWAPSLNWYSADVMRGRWKQHRVWYDLGGNVRGEIDKMTSKWVMGEVERAEAWQWSQGWKGSRRWGWWKVGTAKIACTHSWVSYSSTHHGKTSAVLHEALSLCWGGEWREKRRWQSSQNWDNWVQKGKC